VLRFLNLPSLVLANDSIVCSVENVPLEDVPNYHSHQGYLKNHSCPTRWDVFTKYVDLRDSTLEQTGLDKATNFGLSHNHNQPSDFRHPWGDFEALSYTWGDRADARIIIVNGIRREVSKNLEDALKALRCLRETRLGMYYWVDSLCIDQQNEKERNEQVKRMNDIYSRARAVVAWLGQEEGMDRIAVQTMRYLCRKPRVKNPLRLPPRLLLDGWQALFAFMKKPYWNRAWIIQELAMNHNSTLILCGKFKLTRRMIRLGAVWCQELLQGSEDLSYRFDHDLEPEAWSWASRTLQLVSLTSNPKIEIGLERLLNIVRRADATDEKDKVYSILGLLDTAVSADISPDYSRSEQQVYTDFITSIIKRTGRLEQIMFGGISTKEGWPSWVPDWRLPFERHHITYLISGKASGDLSAKCSFISNGTDGTHLVCSGFKVDTVDGVAAEPSPHCHSTQPRSVSTRYGDRLSDALHQTLLMDHPGATERPLLSVPWTLGCATNTNPSNSPSNPEWLNLTHSRYFHRFHEFRNHNGGFCIGGQTLRKFFPQSSEKSVDITMTLQCMRLALLSLNQRALITTATGYLGLAPIAVRPGDVVAVLLGCKCPVLLRPAGNNLYHVIGECYIHGLMRGEILKQGSREDVKTMDFVLC